MMWFTAEMTSTAEIPDMCDRLSPPVTVQLPLTSDTWVNGGATGTNYNGWAALIARTTGVEPALLTFDRSLLPAGTEIVNAKLTVNMYRESGDPGKELLPLNIAPFNPTTVTFDNLPELSNPGKPTAAVVGPVVVDATSQVKSWQTVAGVSNNALALVAQGPIGGVYLRSIESWPPGQGATLTVTYKPIWP